MKRLERTLDTFQGLIAVWTVFWLFASIVIGIPLVSFTEAPVIAFMSLAAIPWVAVIGSLFVLITAEAWKHSRRRPADAIKTVGHSDGSSSGVV